MDFRAESKMKNEERKKRRGNDGQRGRKKDYLRHRNISCSSSDEAHRHMRCGKSEAFPDSASPPLI